MNKQQRKELSDMLKVIEFYVNDLNEMAEEEQAKYDNMPEGLQESEQGQTISEAADTLEDAASNLQDWVDKLNDYPQSYHQDAEGVSSQ